MGCSHLSSQQSAPHPGHTRTHAGPCCPLWRVCPLPSACLVGVRPAGSCRLSRGSGSRSPGPGGGGERVCVFLQQLSRSQAPQGAPVPRCGGGHLRGRPPLARPSESKAGAPLKGRASGVGKGRSASSQRRQDGRGESHGKG